MLADAPEMDRVEDRGENMPLRSLITLYEAVESPPYPVELAGVRCAGGGRGAEGRTEAALTDYCYIRKSGDVCGARNLHILM